MQNKPTFVIIVTALLVSLACQTLAQPSSDSSVEPTSQATETSVAPSASPLAGLVYRSHNEETNGEMIWQIGDDGKAQMLLPNHFFGMLSPDGNHFVYYDNFWNGLSPCTWLMDFEINETHSLDCSTGGGLPADILGWIPNQPNTLLAILGRSEAGMGGSWGVLGTIDIENGDKEVLDSEHQIQSADISPNGELIAYDGGWLYSWDLGITAFPLQDYGINYPQIGSPAWSPDGTKIAWGLMDNELNSAIGVFDLDKKTAKVLHPFKQKMATDMGTPPPSTLWSADGKWLISSIRAQGDDGQYDDALSGDWIFSIEGNEKYKVDGNFISLSPDSNWVLYINREKDVNILELRVSRFDGSETTKLGEVDDYYQIALWSKDGQYLAFVDNNKKLRYTETGGWKVDEATDVEEVSNLIDWVTPIPAFFESVEILSTITPQPIFSCPNAPRTRLKVGDSARITFTDGKTTRLRSAPEAGDNGVDQLPEGTEFEIINGPVCYPRPGRSDAYVYWEVNIPSRNVTGWLAEGDSNGYYIEPMP
jgi:hypothetical protein